MDTGDLPKASNYPTQESKEMGGSKEQLPSAYWEGPRDYARAIEESQGPRPKHERTLTGQSKPISWLESSPLDEVEIG